MFKCMHLKLHFSRCHSLVSPQQSEGITKFFNTRTVKAQNQMLGSVTCKFSHSIPVTLLP